MLDDVNETIPVVLEITFKCKNVPEVWAVLANYPTERDCFAKAKKDQGMPCHLVVQAETKLLKHETHVEWSKTVNPFALEIARTFGIRRGLIENIHIAYKF